VKLASCDVSCSWYSERAQGHVNAAVRFYLSHQCNLLLFSSFGASYFSLNLFLDCTRIKLLECHLDVASAAAATLGISAKTGGPIVRLNDATGSTLCTVVIGKEETAAFDSLRSDLGDTVRLQSSAVASPTSEQDGDNEEDEGEEDEEVPSCRLVSGEELELELADMSTPVLLDAFAR